MRRIAYFFLAVAAFASLVFVQALKPTSLSASLVFSGWLLLPYILLLLLLVFAARRPPLVQAAHWVIVVETVAGTGFLTEIIFLHPDAQGGLAVLFTPVYQGIIMLLLLPLLTWLFSRQQAVKG